MLTNNCAQQVEDSKREEGCLKYVFLRTQCGPGGFIFEERGKDQAAFDIHFEKEYRSEMKFSEASTPIEIYNLAEARVS